MSAPATARSSRAEVRNPVAADPEVAAILHTLAGEHPEAADALRGCLRALSRKWRSLAQHSWEKHKAPLAAYHKANAVNARHLALAIPSEARSKGRERPPVIADLFDHQGT